MSTRKANFRLRARSRDGKNLYGDLGRAWINVDSAGKLTHINIKLNPCVELRERDELQLTLFPFDEDLEEGG